MRVFHLIECILILSLITACDSASISARVRPDKQVDLVEDSKSISADVYLSKDKLIELQIYGSGGTMGVGAPAIKAILVNNRSTPIQIDILKATYQPKWSRSPKSIEYAWYEDCPSEDSSHHLCKSGAFELQPHQTKRVRWSYGAEGEFRLEIQSRNESPDIIVAQFKRCNPLWGKCETISK